MQTLHIEGSMAGSSKVSSASSSESSCRGSTELVSHPYPGKSKSNTSQFWLTSTRSWHFPWPVVQGKCTAICIFTQHREKLRNSVLPLDNSLNCCRRNFQPPPAFILSKPQLCHRSTPNTTWGWFFFFPFNVNCFPPLIDHTAMAISTIINIGECIR